MFELEGTLSSWFDVLELINYHLAAKKFGP